VVQKKVLLLGLVVGLILAFVPGVLASHGDKGTPSCYDPFRHRNVPVLFFFGEFRECASVQSHHPLNKWRNMTGAVSYWTGQRYYDVQKSSCKNKRGRFPLMCNNFQRSRLYER